MGTFAFIFPESWEHRWWKPLEAAGLQVAILNTTRPPKSLQPPEFSVGRVIHRRASIIVTLRRATGRLIEIAGSQGIYAGGSFVNLSPGRSELMNAVGRLLLASGAKSIAAGCGFKTMFTGHDLSTLDLSHCLSGLGVKIRTSEEYAPHWVVTRRWAKVDVFLGNGLDMDSGSPVPFIAVDYQLSLLRQVLKAHKVALQEISATEVLAGEVVQSLKMHGLVEMNVIVPWPS